MPILLNSIGSDRYSNLVMDDRFDLRDVPTACITPELCLAAVKHDGLALKLLPDDILNDEIILEAIKQNVDVIKIVNPLLLTREMCTVAVSKTGKLLEHVPEELQTPDLCTVAVRDDPFNIQHVEFPSVELCTMALEKNPRTIKFMKLLVSHELLSRVENFYVGIEQFIPTRYKTPEILSKLAKLYDDEGYECFGKIRINMVCEKDSGSPCDHRVILQNGEMETLDSRQIGRMLKIMNLRHPHFDEIMKNDKAVCVRMGPIKIYIEKCSDSKPCRMFTYDTPNLKKCDGKYFCHSIQRN